MVVIGAGQPLTTFNPFIRHRIHQNLGSHAAETAVFLRIQLLDLTKHAGAITRAWFWTFIRFFSGPMSPMSGLAIVTLCSETLVATL